MCRAHCAVAQCTLQQEVSTSRPTQLPDRREIIIIEAMLPDTTQFISHDIDESRVHTGEAIVDEDVERTLHLKALMMMMLLLLHAE